MNDLVTTAIALVLAALGAFLVLVAGIGVLRMPDLLTRMHASSKAATLGGALILVAVAVWFDESTAWVRVVLIVLFLFATAPVAAHMIGRAGYRGGVELTDETIIDEYRPTVEEAED